MVITDQAYYGGTRSATTEHNEQEVDALIKED
jgi:hypothetical protein